MSLKTWLSSFVGTKPQHSFGGIETILTEFGKNADEEREIDDILRDAISWANSGRWQEAAPIFRDFNQRQPDYDVPCLWLAEFAKQNEGPSAAVTALRDAAGQCRRKTELLETAAELSLLECNDLGGAIRLFVQAIAAMRTKPSRSEVTRQRAFVFMKEIFVGLGDFDGVKWARGIQSFTKLDSAMVAEIQAAIKRTPLETRRALASQLAEVRGILQKMFPS